jgi:hypothetical protein
MKAIHLVNLKFRAKKENLPAKRIQAETMSAYLVFQKNYYGSIVCCQNQRFEMESYLTYSDG